MGSACRYRWQNKSPEQKKLLAMTIDSDMNEHGASRGSISRNCENAWSHSVYSAFEQLFRSALRGHGPLLQRLGGERTGLRERRVKRRYDHAAGRNIQLGNWCDRYQEY